MELSLKVFSDMHLLNLFPIDNLNNQIYCQEYQYIVTFFYQIVNNLLSSVLDDDLPSSQYWI